jgi:hypothetical protein
MKENAAGRLTAGPGDYHVGERRESMFQAIETKFLGPTNFRGPRIVAKAEAGRIVVPWDHALNPAENHARAARALAVKLGWRGTYRGGSLPNSYVFVRSTGFSNAMAFELDFEAETSV